VPGKTLLFGSDVPIVRANAEDSLVAAVHRKRTATTPGGPPSQPIAPQQSISDSQARAAFAPV
jgi:hypothetical protein